MTNHHFHCICVKLSSTVHKRYQLKLRATNQKDNCMNLGSSLIFIVNKLSAYYFTSRTCSLLLTKICIAQFGCMTISAVSTHISRITISLSSLSIQCIRNLTIPDFRIFTPLQVSHNHLNYYTVNGWNNKLT